MERLVEHCSGDEVEVPGASLPTNLDKTAYPSSSLRPIELEGIFQDVSGNPRHVYSWDVLKAVFHHNKDLVINYDPTEDPFEVFWNEIQSNRRPRVQSLHREDYPDFSAEERSIYSNDDSSAEEEGSLMMEHRQQINNEQPFEHHGHEIFLQPNMHDSFLASLSCDSRLSPAWSNYMHRLEQINNSMIAFDKSHFQQPFSLELQPPPMGMVIPLAQRFTRYGNLDFSFFCNIDLLGYRKTLKLMECAAALQLSNRIRPCHDPVELCYCFEAENLLPVFFEFGFPINRGDLAVYCPPWTVDDFCRTNDSHIESSALSTILETSMSLEPENSLYLCKFLLCSLLSFTVLLKLRNVFEKLIIVHNPARNVAGVLLYKKRYNWAMMTIFEEMQRVADAVDAENVDAFTADTVKMYCDDGGIENLYVYNQNLVYNQAEKIIRSIDSRIIPH